MARRKKSPTTVKVNFKGVESRRTPAEGDYLCKVLEAKQGESAKGNDQIEFITEIADGEYKGSKLYLYCPLSDQSLWKLHAFLTALGEDVPEDEMDIDLEELVDKEFMGVVGHDSYNGKKQARLVDFDVAEAYEGKDEGKKGKKNKKSKDDEAGDEKSSKKDKSKKPKDKDEEKSSKKGKKEKVEKYDADEVREMNAKKLQKLIDKHDLDVDLDDFKTDKKKVAAVISALEDAELIDD